MYVIDFALLLKIINILSSQCISFCFGQARSNSYSASWRTQHEYWQCTGTSQQLALNMSIMHQLKCNILTQFHEGFSPRLCFKKNWRELSALNSLKSKSLRYQGPSGSSRAQPYSQMAVDVQRCSIPLSIVQVAERGDRTGPGLIVLDPHPVTPWWLILPFRWQILGNINVTGWQIKCRWWEEVLKLFFESWQSCSINL